MNLIQQQLSGAKQSVSERDAALHTATQRLVETESLRSQLSTAHLQLTNTQTQLQALTQRNEALRSAEAYTALELREAHTALQQTAVQLTALQQQLSEAQSAASKARTELTAAEEREKECLGKLKANEHTTANLQVWVLFVALCLLWVGML